MDAARNRTLTFAIRLSLLAGVVILGVKIWAALHTGSAAIYSDAAESVVHLFAVAFAAYSMRIALKPADESHHFGHGKVQFFSAGFEGAMISLAALLIFYEAARHWMGGEGVSHPVLGLWVTGAVALVNLALGLWLRALGKRHHSTVLEANGEHVLTDVWTSVGVLVGLGLVVATGKSWWDPLAAILVAANILRIGVRLMRRAVAGLMDESDPEIESRVRDLLEESTAGLGLQYHQLRTRFSGETHWVEFHLIFPDGTPIEEAHDRATRIEAKLAADLAPAARIITHLEPTSAAGIREPWE